VFFWAPFSRPVSFCTAQPRSTCVCKAFHPYLPRPKGAPRSYLMACAVSRHVQAPDGKFCICLCFLGPFFETGLVLHSSTPQHMCVQGFPPTSAKTKRRAWVILDGFCRQQACAGAGWELLYLFVFFWPLFRVWSRFARFNPAAHVCARLSTHICQDQEARLGHT